MLHLRCIRLTAAADKPKDPSIETLAENYVLQLADDSRVFCDKKTGKDYWSNVKNPDKRLYCPDANIITKTHYWTEKEEMEDRLGTIKAKLEGDSLAAEYEHGFMVLGIVFGGFVGLIALLRAGRLLSRYWRLQSSERRASLFANKVGTQGAAENAGAAGTGGILGPLALNATAETSMPKKMLGKEVNFEELEAWDQERFRVNALDMTGRDDLDRFSVFFADSVNKIALAAMLKKKITFHVFGIRALIVRKITEDELGYLKDRIKQSTSIFAGSRLTTRMDKALKD